MQDQQSMSRHTRYRCFLTALISLLSGIWVSSAQGAAGLSDALVRWNMQTVDDSNGGNSQLSVVDNGDATLIGVGVFLYLRLIVKPKRMTLGVEGIVILLHRVARTIDVDRTTELSG